MRNLFIAIITVLLALYASVGVYAQAVPVGDIREEQLRLQQLLGDSVALSFSNRSVWTRMYSRHMEASGGNGGWWTQNLAPREERLGEWFTVGAYEPVFATSFNSSFPYGENNGAAWYGKGLTSELQGGIYLTSDYLTISLRPHLVYQQNSDFEIPRFAFTEYRGEAAYGSEIGIQIDRPYRFGPDPYWTSSWGHSSISLHYQNLEAGYGNEPMWWGPSVQYPLVMSNNAPGFGHVFLRSREPVRVPYVGSFEFTWVGGWPRESSYYYGPFQGRQRRTVGLNANWSPSFAPGLYIGLTRVYHFYDDSVPFMEDMLRVIDPFTKVSLPEEQQDANPRERYENQLSSVYFRWVFPEAGAEIYSEYLREDHSYDLRDFATEPHNNRAWSFGFQKILDVFPFLDLAKLNLEYTHLTASRIREIGRSQAYVYRNARIPQGHTNEGQVLGAAIGLGSNSLFVGLDGYVDNFKVGLFTRRLADNDQFLLNYNRAFAKEYGTGDIWRHRINWDIGADILWKRDSMILSGKLVWTKAYNYGRYGYGDFDVDFETLDPYDVINLQLQLGVRYLF